MDPTKLNNDNLKIFKELLLQMSQSSFFHSIIEELKKENENF